MTDNTQINTGSGDIVRDIDRAGVKTQVIQLDVGGKYAEALVDPFNPMPTNDIPTGAAQSSDSPTFVAITGDPNGDFAGVNILEKLVDDSNDLKMAVRVVNPPKLDAQGAQMVSDAPAPINLVGVSGQFLYLDTTGYQSLHISVPTVGGLAATLAASNDGITYAPTLGYTVQSTPATPNATISAGAPYVFPVVARFIRFQITTLGSAIVYLRNSPAPHPSLVVPQNIASIGGVTVATGFVPINYAQYSGATVVGAGLAGVTAFAGPTANAIAPTANPNLIAGIDSGTPGTLLGVPLTRRVLLDNIGKLRIAEESPVSSFQQTPALNVQDTGLFEDQDKYQLLAQILLELRINNQLMSDLPLKLYGAFQSLQLAPTAQNLFAGLVSDEPAAYRSDPTIFNQ